MKIALAQMNPVVGDIRGNVRKVAEAISVSRAAGAAVVVFPELSVCGYPPRDLLRRAGFVRDCSEAVERLAEICTDITAVVGFARANPSPRGRPLQNCAAVLAGGRVRHVHVKSLLPTYDVFDESRYFAPGGQASRLEIDGLSLGLTICEDLWDRQALGRELYGDDPVAELTRLGVGAIVNIAASPFQMGKATVKESLLSRQARRAGVPILYVNQVGGNDELIFDGGSCVVAADGEVIGRARSFEEDVLIVDLGRPADNRVEPHEDDLPRLGRALKLGLRDYVHTCGFSRVVLGVSGGIDSAVVAALAADALGPANVLGLAMPSRHSSGHSITDAQALCRNLGIECRLVPIEGRHRAFEELLSPVLAGGNTAIADENIQARIRGNLVMAVSNALGHLALATGNKSELAVGYCTLYGDMCGGLAVIGDVYKSTVFPLARQLNAEAGFERIPEHTIVKPPSAELKPNQLDQDSLPPYDLLDAILERYVERDESVSEIAAAGFDGATVARVLTMVDRSEFKRKQAAPVLKVTARAFGVGRRMPIAQRYTQ